MMLDYKRIRKGAESALVAAEQYESEEPFAYFSPLIPVAVVTAENAKVVLEMIDRIEELEEALDEAGQLLASAEWAVGK